MKQKEYTKEQKAALKTIITYISTFTMGTPFALLVSLQMNLLTCDNDEIEQMELVVNWLELLQGLMSELLSKDFGNDLSMLIEDFSKQFPMYISKAPISKGATPEEEIVN